MAIVNKSRRLRKDDAPGESMCRNILDVIAANGDRVSVVVVYGKVSPTLVQPEMRKISHRHVPGGDCK